VKVGDLVMYSNTAYPTRYIGVVLETDLDNPETFVDYRVLWTNHYVSHRDWYRKDELVKL
jgi:hypothetical protein